MLTVAISKRNKLQNIIVLTPKDGKIGGMCIRASCLFAQYIHFFVQKTVNVKSVLPKISDLV